MKNTSFFFSIFLLLIILCFVGDIYAQPGWNPQNSGTTQMLMSVCFTDTDNGWTVGTAGEVFHTGNGGINWIQQETGTYDNLMSVYFFDVNNGWIVGQYSFLFTNDGGATWTSQPVGQGNMKSVIFVNANNGWAAGNSGVILHTDDGGSNWNQQTTPSTLNLKSIHFIDVHNGWAVGDGGVILQTSNGGAIWDMQTSGTTSHLESVYAVNANIAYIVGELGLILYTNDGGNTWTPQVSGTTWYLNSVQFVNNTVGYAVGFMGAILYTNSGGITGIKEVNSPIPQNYTLHQNYPNPFNLFTEISYSLKEPGLVSISIYDQQGRKIKSLVDEFQPNNAYSVIVDGSKLESGIYFYNLKVDNEFLETKRLFKNLISKFIKHQPDHRKLNERNT